jgi:flagellar biogenesis protein FliO
MRTLATAILGAAMILGAQAPITPACAAAAVRAPSLTAVSFTPRKDSLEFVFRAQAPITADQVSVYGDADDAEVLNLKIEGAAVTRRWVTMPDAQIDRALLHSGAGKGDAAVLRIRMQSKSAVVAAILDATKVHEAEGAVVVKVPRTAAVAAEWALAEKPAAEAAPAVAIAAAAVLPAPVSAAAVPAPVSAAAVAAPVSAAAVAAPVVETPVVAETDKLPSLADAPLTLTDDSTLGSEDPGAVVANAGVSESTGMGAAAATLCLMLAGGFLLWRKVKGHTGDRGTGRLIRPLGTHVLGPKQGLLLLDVAGEMVLIGTSDKGVQMLTKIEKSDRAEAPAMARATMAPAAPVASAKTNHADLELLRNESAVRAPKMNVAERATAAIAKVRALSEARAAKAKGMETADEDVTADALERSFFDRADEHLAQAADGVEDDFEPRAENFFARLKKAAERPAESESAPAVKTPTPRVGNPTPAPVAARKAAPAAPVAPRNAAGDDAALTNDILRKIRQLQGA